MNRHASGILALAITIALTAACSSGGDGGGIGGSGIVAQGTITGFGSAFVNGVEYNTDDTDFTVDEVAGVEADLAIGMVVRVTGSVNDDDVTGTAERIVYDAELEGPVVNPPLEGDEGQTKSFTVLGTNVVVTKSTTVFGNDVPGFTFGTVSQHDVVEVSGFFVDADNTLRATRIEKEGRFDPANPGNTEVEVEGTISDYNAINNTFKLGTLTVTFDIGSTELPVGGLRDDLVVEVEGSLQDAATTMIAAREIEIEDDYPDNADNAEIQGVVSGFSGDLSNFAVDRQPVDASGTGVEFEPSSLASALDNGIEIEVEGPIVNGVLFADELKRRGGNVEIRAAVFDKDASTLILELVPGAPGRIAVSVDATTTEFENEEDDRTFGLADIGIGDFVEIKGYKTGSPGTVIVAATKVKRDEDEPENEIKVQGPVDSWNEMNDRSVTVLGVKFGTDDNTEFEVNDVEFSDAVVFFDALSEGDIVEIKDELPPGMTLGDGIAKEVEKED